MKRRNYFVLCRARGGLRALHLRRLWEKAGENFQKNRRSVGLMNQRKNSRNLFDFEQVPAIIIHA